MAVVVPRPGTGNRVAANVYVETNDHGAAVRITNYAHRISDLRELWPLVTESFTQRERLWFERVGEGSWPPLTARYALWKAVHFPGKPMLVRTQSLKDSLTDPHRAVLAETDHMLVLGSDSDVAGYHQTGTSKMPQRKVLAPIARIMAGVARLMEHWIQFPDGFR